MQNLIAEFLRILLGFARTRSVHQSGDPLFKSISAGAKGVRLAARAAMCDCLYFTTMNETTLGMPDT